MDKNLKDKKLSSLAKNFKSFQDGEAGAPTLQLHAKAMIKEGQVSVVLSKEVIDLDGEIVQISGLKIPNQVPFIDSHNLNGSIIENLLGRVVDLKKTEDSEGVPQLTGTIEFAKTPNGEIAKKLYEDGIATDVSIGFAVFDYDYETGLIKSSQLYELSAVIKGANEYAKVEKAIDDKLSHLKEIKPKIKEYRRFFMDEKLFESLNIQKTGDELVDIKNISDSINAILSKPKETPKANETLTEETPKYATLDNLAERLTEIIQKADI